MVPRSHITAPGVAYGERYPRSLPQAPRGQGWVSARLVGAALANGSLPAGRLHQAPNDNSAYANVSRQDSPVGTGDPVQRLHACSGIWGLVEVGGHRGWWRRHLRQPGHELQLTPGRRCAWPARGL